MIPFYAKFGGEPRRAMDQRGSSEQAIVRKTAVDGGLPGNGSPHFANYLADQTDERVQKTRLAEQSPSPLGGYSIAGHTN